MVSTVLKFAHDDLTIVGMTPEEAEKEDALGLFLPLRATIKIRSDLRPADQARVLIHELLHACYARYGLPEGKMTEEEVCTALDSPLAALFRDAPELFGILHQALHNGRPIV